MASLSNGFRRKFPPACHPRRFSHEVVHFSEKLARPALDGAHGARVKEKHYVLLPFAMQIAQPRTESFQSVMDV
jgi:hypothetical protein